jgi:hypothetical protein
MATGTVVVPASLPFGSSGPSVLAAGAGGGAVPPAPPGFAAPPVQPQVSLQERPPAPVDWAFEPSQSMQQSAVSAPVYEAPVAAPAAPRFEAPAAVASFPLLPSEPTVFRALGVMLRFDTGDEIVLDRTVLIGRDPAAAAGDDGIGLIPVKDPSMSVSKTHMALGVGGGEAWVEDRNSTNGVSIVNGRGEAVKVDVGRRSVVPLGSKVYFGDRWVEVQPR